LDAWPIKTLFSFKARSMFQIERIHKAVKKSNGKVRIINSSEDVHEILEARKNREPMMGIMLGLEGAQGLEGKMENLKEFYDAGVRLIGLMHYYNDEVGTSTSGTGTKGVGLTDFGKMLVKDMAELDMIIDISHSSGYVVDDVFRI